MNSDGDSGFRLRARDVASAWAPTLIWAALMFVASTDLMSSEHTSRYLVPFLRWLRPDISTMALARIHFAIRKAAHVTEYAIFASLIWRGLHKGTPFRKRPTLVAVAAFLLAAFFAISDEFHQSFVPSRGAAVVDVGFDCCGAFLGIVALATWQATRRHAGRDT